MASLATAGELNLHLQREVDPASADQALALASGAVRAYCGWGLAREETTFYFEGDGNPIVSLPTMELVTVSEIRIDGDLYVPTTFLPAWSRKGQGYLGCGWARYAQFEVDLLHGYDPVPDLVKLVTLDLASRQIGNPEALVSATVGEVSKTWSSAGSTAQMTTLHERLLDTYRI